MAKQSAKKIGWVAVTCVLTMSLMATPARASHEPDIVVPVVAAFALGALWSHGHGDHYYQQGYRYERRGHYGNQGHGNSHKRHYSKGNYNHGYSNKKHYSQGQASYRPRQGRGSNSGHGQKHGSKRDGHTGSRRKY